MTIPRRDLLTAVRVYTQQLSKHERVRAVHSTLTTTRVKMVADAGPRALGKMTMMDALASKLRETKQELGLFMGYVDRQNKETEAMNNTSVPGTKPLTEKTMRDAIIGDHVKPPSSDAVKKPDFPSNVSCSMFSYIFHKYSHRHMMCLFTGLSATGSATRVQRSTHALTCVPQHSNF